jgi:hypothetical protein
VKVKFQIRTNDTQFLEQVAGISLPYGMQLEWLGSQGAQRGVDIQIVQLAVNVPMTIISSVASGIILELFRAKRSEGRKVLIDPDGDDPVDTDTSDAKVRLAEAIDQARASSVSTL